MIQPQDGQEARYACNLAALLVRAYDQSTAGDEPGSKTLMATYRSLKEQGTVAYRERNAGLVEYALVLATEEPRSERLTRFMTKQDERHGIHVIAPETPNVMGNVGIGDDDVLGIEPEAAPGQPKPKRRGRGPRVTGDTRKPRAKKEVR